MSAANRTTHSDLAREILGLATKLAGLPGSTPNADATIREMLTATARILGEQDARIDAMTFALRGARASLKHPSDTERRQCALEGVNAALAVPVRAPRFPSSAGPAEQINTGDK